MEKLKSLWHKDPGLFASVSFHALAFVFLIVNFAHPPKFDDATEALPVEMITTSELNQIMSGEETAKQMPKPQRRVDKVADLEERHPTPPLAEARKDTPTPPTPDKPNDDPGLAEKPTPSTAAAPPPPPTPAPTPPERPVEKAEAPKPPPKPAEIKPPPPDAEALDAKPPPRPKDLPKTEAKETKEAKAAPEPPHKPDRHDKTEPKKDNLGDVAKLLATMKPPKPVAKARAGNAAPDSERRDDFSLDKITALLDHEAPQHKASTGQKLTQVASLGTATGHSEKLSATLTAQINNWLIDKYRGCWSYFGLGASQDYIPRVRVRMAPNGSLMGQPELLNPPSDPNLRSLADSAVRAVNKCDPMQMPDWVKSHYDTWKDLSIKFDPKEMT